MSDASDNGSAAEPQRVTTYEVAEDGGALIRLDRPRARNAINTQMLSERLKHLAVARRADAARVLALAASVAAHPPESVARLKRMLHEWDDIEGRSAAEGVGQVEHVRSLGFP